MKGEYDTLVSGFTIVSSSVPDRGAWRQQYVIFGIFSQKDWLRNKQPHLCHHLREAVKDVSTRNQTSQTRIKEEGEPKRQNPDQNHQIIPSTPSYYLYHPEDDFDGWGVCRKIHTKKERVEVKAEETHICTWDWVVFDKKRILFLLTLSPLNYDAEETLQPSCFTLSIQKDDCHVSFFHIKRRMEVGMIQEKSHLSFPGAWLSSFTHSPVSVIITKVSLSQWLSSRELLCFQMIEQETEPVNTRLSIGDGDNRLTSHCNRKWSIKSREIQWKCAKPMNPTSAVVQLNQQ
jgi:hypothetical protein